MSEIRINKFNVHCALSIDFPEAEIYKFTMKRDPQLSFEMRSHGGSRKRSGRKKRIENEPKHVARAEVDSRIPMHISFKLIPGTPCLRTPKFMKEFALILANARRRGLRVQQYTIESNHIHLLAEADSNSQVSRGMSSLKISIVWALRRIFMYHGRVFVERYFVVHLKSPTQMRNALRYVLFNHAKHTKCAFFADVYSSIFGFGDAHEFAEVRAERAPPWFAAIARELADAKTWMQKTGWRRARR